MLLQIHCCRSGVCMKIGADRPCCMAWQLVFIDMNTVDTGRYGR